MKRRIAVAGFIILSIFIICNLCFSADITRQSKDELYQNIELFSDAITLIQSDYVDEKAPKDLIYGALQGMLSSLDPHSQFLTPDEFKDLKIDTSGKFGGLGIELGIKDGLLTIITPLEDAPAWRAGVKAGDRIVKIDGQSTRQLTLDDAVKKLRGKPGTEVTITVLREKEDKFLDIKIVRDIIKIKDIKDAQILEDNIGYIRLIEFRENTARDLNSTLERLTKEGMNGLILDLRNNPGGLLDAAVDVTSEFIEPQRIIVTTKGRIERQNLELKSNFSNPYLSMPMVVLINQGSASGSEILAGCLQDYKRAIILGEQSFGKGSVQTVIPLPDGSALRLTTSKYFTPLGQTIHGKGITPDIIVESTEVVTEKEQENDIKEETFRKLDNKSSKEETLKPREYKSDFQIRQAIDLIKGIRIYKEQVK
ncbi:MAG: S41 family peptidase [Candidatus Omnitrophota bacterium]